MRSYADESNQKVPSKGSTDDESTDNAIEQNFVFLGLVGMDVLPILLPIFPITFTTFVGLMDPPRTQVIRSIKTCQEAGVGGNYDNRRSSHYCKEYCYGL